MAYLAKSFKNFLKFKKNSGRQDGKSFKRSSDSRREFQKADGKKDFEWNKSSEGSSNSTATCYECNGVDQLKRECPNYLRGKGKAMSATLSDSKRSSSKSDDEANEVGNYTTFIAISSGDAKSHLDEINEEDGDYLKAIPTEDEVVPETNFSHYQFSNNEEEDGKKDLVVLQQNAFLKVSGKYARTAENAIRGMKKAEEEKEVTLEELEIYMCKVEELKVELEGAYSKIRFLEHEVIEANAKVDRISSKKLDFMLQARRPLSLKSGLRYIRENSSSDPKISMDGLKSVKFVSAKISEDKEKNDESLDEKKRKELAPKIPKGNEKTSAFAGKGKAVTKSLPKKQ